MSLITARWGVLVLFFALLSSAIFSTACSEKPEPAENANQAEQAAQQAPDNTRTSQAAPDPGPQMTLEGPYRYPADLNRSQPKYVKCWAIFQGEATSDFVNPYDSIKGPAEVLSLSGLEADGSDKNHPDWTGRVTTVRSGATARVTLFDQPDLRGDSYTLQPDQKVDLADIPIDTVASLRIEYVAP